jgi:hypothetical protein
MVVIAVHSRATALATSRRNERARIALSSQSTPCRGWHARSLGMLESQRADVKYF